MPFFKKQIPEQISDTADAAAQMMRRPRNRRRTLMLRVLVVLLILAIAGCSYFAYQYYRLQSNPTLKAQNDTQKALASLSKVMVIPNDPNPVVATITDRTKLQSQPFFKNALNGDQVIIFPSTMKAVLFRPSTGKIIDIAPLEQSSTDQSTETAPQTETTSSTKATTKTSTADTSTSTSSK